MYVRPITARRYYVERKIVQLAVIVGYRAIGVTVEGHKGIDKIPDLFVGSMVDVCAVFMDVDTFRLITIDNSAQMRTLVNNKAAFASRLCLVRKR